MTVYIVEYIRPDDIYFQETSEIEAVFHTMEDAVEFVETLIKETGTVVEERVVYPECREWYLDIGRFSVNLWVVR